MVWVYEVAAPKMMPVLAGSPEGDAGRNKVAAVELVDPVVRVNAGHESCNHSGSSSRVGFH